MKNCTEEVMAKHIYDILSGYDGLKSIKKVLVDNTAVNTRWKNGWLICEAKEKFGQNLHIVRCALH